MQKVGNEEKATRTGGRESVCEQGRNVMLDVVPGDDAGMGLTDAVEDCDLLFGQEPSWEGERSQPFFLERP